MLEELRLEAIAHIRKASEDFSIGSAQRDSGRSNMEARPGANSVIDRINTWGFSSLNGY